MINFDNCLLNYLVYFTINSINIIILDNFFLSYICISIPLNWYINKFILNYSTYIFKKINFLYNISLKLKTELFLLKIHFRFKGGWLYLRKDWPMFSSFRVRIGHPLYYLYDYSFKRFYRHYLSYSGMVFINYSFFHLTKFIFAFYSLRRFNSYTKIGLKFSRSKILLKPYSLGSTRHL